MRKLIAAAALLFLAACDPPFTEGTVHEKVYEPANTYVMVFPMTFPCGKNCVSTVMVPFIMHDDEDYVFNVLGHDKNGDLKMRRIYVTKEAFDAYNEGDWFVIEPPYGDEDTGNTKRRQ